MDDAGTSAATIEESEAEGGVEVAAKRRRWPRRLRRIGLAFAIVAGICVVDAQSIPGDDPFIVKMGIWGRERGLGFAITWFEQAKYSLHPPTTGGTASVEQALQDSGYTKAPVAPTKVEYDPLRPIAEGSPVPGEGQWRTLIAVGDEPVISAALLRPDSVHTSYLSAVVRINHTRARLQLHPGSEDPGDADRFGIPTKITKDDWSSIIGGFNGGFKIKDARGGFYLNGVTAGTLTDGAASLVTFADGRTTVGQWGRDLTLSADVVAVRQNLRLLVDGGEVTPSADAAVKSTWGATVDGAYHVWRTGIGVRPDGDLVFVLGDALSARSLAQLLQAAGAVRAMQLDINEDWAAFYYFTRPATDATARPKAHKVIKFKRPLERFFSTVTRDFYTISLVR
ncbi:MAG: hypothetical protein RL745_376 [Actinomycetota bacterium]